MTWGYVAVGVGTVVAGYMGSESSKSAAQTQAEAARKAGDTTLAMFDTQQGNLAPWRTTGQNANALLAYGEGLPDPMAGTPAAAPQIDWAKYLQDNPDVAASSVYGQNPQGHYADWGQKEGRQVTYMAAPPSTAAVAGAAGITPGMFTHRFNAEDFGANKDPSYDWRLSQGLDAMMNRASVGGGVAGSGGSSPIAGNTLKAINDYAQGSASTEYSAAFDRYNTMMNTIFGRLSATSGTGANAAGGIAGLGMGAVGSAGAFNTDAAAALAAGRVGSTNALTGAGSSLANNYLLYQMMQNNNGGAGGAGTGGNNVSWIEQPQTVQ